MRWKWMFAAAAFLGACGTMELEAFGGRGGARQNPGRGARVGERASRGLIGGFDANEDGAVSAAELGAGLAARQAELVKKIDTDGDGTIEAAELEALEGRLERKVARLDADDDGTVSPAELAANVEKKKTEILEKLDADDDGSIEAGELAARPERPGRHPRRPSLRSFDANGDGAVSGDELAAGLAARQAEMLKKVDSDANGAISAAELAALNERLARKLKELDTDKDGAVSAAELAARLQARKAEILKELDDDGDGIIEAGELPAASPGCARTEEEAAEDEAAEEARTLAALFGGTEFVRGDATGDDRVDISDPVSVLGFLYLGLAAPACEDAADADDDGGINLSDPITMLSHMFNAGTARISAPFPEKGPDSTADSLTCGYE